MGSKLTCSFGGSSEVPGTCWRPSRKHQATVQVGLHNRSVFPPAVPLAGVNHRNISNWSPSSELEVVGADRVRPLPGPTEHVEQPKEGDRRLHTDEHLAEVDGDHHQK
jgi:hypothetical protein